MISSIQYLAFCRVMFIYMPPPFASFGSFGAKETRLCLIMRFSSVHRMKSYLMGNLWCWSNLFVGDSSNSLLNFLIWLGYSSILFYFLFGWVVVGGGWVQLRNGGWVFGSLFLFFCDALRLLFVYLLYTFRLLCSLFCFILLLFFMYQKEKKSYLSSIINGYV